MNQATFPQMYERELVDPLFRPWAELTVDELGLAASDRVLDVACGTGIARSFSNCAASRSVNWGPSPINATPTATRVNLRRYCAKRTSTKCDRGCLPVSHGNFTAVMSAFAPMPSVLTNEMWWPRVVMLSSCTAKPTL
jgi:hypothetical protein